MGRFGGDKGDGKARVMGRFGGDIQTDLLLYGFYSLASCLQ